MPDFMVKPVLLLFEQEIDAFELFNKISLKSSNAMPDHETNKQMICVKTDVMLMKQSLCYPLYGIVVYTTQLWIWKEIKLMDGMEEKSRSNMCIKLLKSLFAIVV